MIRYLVEEFSYKDVQILNEGADKPMRIKAPMISFNKKNANGRTYKKDTCLPAVERFIKEYVNTNSALMELNHPLNRLQTDPSESAGIIESINVEGDYAYGTAKIFKDLPKGRIVYGLLKEGVRMGVSTRASGNVDLDGSVIGNTFNLMAVDFVHIPSGVGCYIDTILENKEFIIQDNKIVELAYKNLNKGLIETGSKKLLYLFNKFLFETDHKPKISGLDYLKTIKSETNDGKAFSLHYMEGDNGKVNTVRYFQKNPVIGDAKKLVKDYAGKDFNVVVKKYNEILFACNSKDIKEIFPDIVI